MYQNTNMKNTASPPVMEARRWLDAVDIPADRPLLNVSQAAPTAPPPIGLRQAIADAALSQDETHLYGAVLGRPDLRARFAQVTNSHFKTSTLTADHVAITAGCNQAFAAATAALAEAGDEILIPTPWYFNHNMWLDMQGIKTVALPTGDTLVPSIDVAKARITDKTRAILLVTPNNPGGVEYPPALIDAFFELCKAHGIALIIDETYRDFAQSAAPAHHLFDRSDWQETLIQLYSFSKAYRLTGHRVGVIMAGRQLLPEIEKFLDTVTICPNQLGQIGALWGLNNLKDWKASERDEILARRQAMIDGFAQVPDWNLLGCGAYFAYVQHPFKAPSEEIAKGLLKDQSILMLPGTMFKPATDPTGARELRIAFANIDLSQIAIFFERLKAFQPTSSCPS
ncbi:MAG: aminotransferase [Halocynthiibacter sp.]